MRALASAMATIAIAAPALAGDVGAFPSEDQRYRLVLTVADGEPELASGKVTTLRARLVDEGPAATAAQPVVGPPAPTLKTEGLTFQALMPEHGHGMPLRPTIEQVAPDEFVVRGVKLAMAGSWQMNFAVSVGETPVSFLVPVTVDR